MLGQPFEQFPAQVQSVMAAIGRFEPHQHTQGVGVVIEPAVFRQGFAQRILPGMAERRVADVVSEAQRLGQVLVQPQRARNRASDLGDFETVGQTHAVVIAVGCDEHLGLVAQAAERDRMDDPVAVALEGAARTAHPAGIERKFAAAARLRVGRVNRAGHASPPAPSPLGANLIPRGSSRPPPRHGCGCHRKSAGHWHRHRPPPQAPYRPARWPWPRPVRAW